MPSSFLKLIQEPLMDFISTKDLEDIPSVMLEAIDLLSQNLRMNAFKLHFLMPQEEISTVYFLSKL